MIVKLIAVIAVIFSFICSPFAPRVSVREKGASVAEEKGTDSLCIYDEIKGVNDSMFVISRPDREKLNTVSAAQFGLDTASTDNFAAMQAALCYCGENPGTRLVIEPGVYLFETDKALSMDSLQNIYIDGAGARFIFCHTGNEFDIVNCRGVEVNGLMVDWNHEKAPLASIVRVKNASADDHTLELYFTEREEVNADTKMKAITRCDGTTLTFGAKLDSKEVYLYQSADYIKNVEKINSRTLKVTHNGCMDNFKNGETYILRHFVYDGCVFRIGGASTDLTFDGINIYGGSGMAFVVQENASHFQILNTFIGVEKGTGNKGHVSLTADAIHIVNSDGCFRVENCDISGMGDDALNVHDGLGYLSGVQGNTADVIASAMRMKPGDTVGFKDSGFTDTMKTAVIKSVVPKEGITWSVTFEEDISSFVKTGFLMYSKECCSDNYVLRGNYIHECRARGFLLQSSNGICENNRFYKTMGPAIRIIMDVMPTLWQEGTGVDSLVIRNNEFDTCDFCGWGQIIELGGNIDGSGIVYPAFSNIEITDNSFVNISKYILNADNLNGFVFRGNTFTVSDVFEKSEKRGRIRFGSHCYNVSYCENRFTDADSAMLTAQCPDPVIWAQINSSIDK